MLVAIISINKHIYSCAFIAPSLTPTQGNRCPLYNTNMCCGNRWFPMCACTAPRCPRADKMGATGKIRGHHTDSGWPDLLNDGFWLCPDYLARVAASAAGQTQAQADGQRLRTTPPDCPDFRWLELKIDSQGKMCAACRGSAICKPVALAAASVARGKVAQKPAWRP